MGVAPPQHFTIIRNGLICSQSTWSHPPRFLRRCPMASQNILTFLCLKSFLPEGAHSLSHHCLSSSPLKPAILRRASGVGTKGRISLLGVPGGSILFLRDAFFPSRLLFCGAVPFSRQLFSAAPAHYSRPRLFRESAKWSRHSTGNQRGRQRGGLTLPPSHRGGGLGNVIPQFTAPGPSES